MSRLKLFQPTNADTGTTCDKEATVLQFPAAERRLPGRSQIELILRARAVRRNRCCPHCGHPDVEPLVLEAAIRHRELPAVPGTGTLAGFHCGRCDAVWQVPAA